MNPESLECGAWYPDEEICRFQSQNQKQWIRRQRKIAAKAKNKETYFTVSMLKHPCVIGVGITGIDPDGTDAQRELDERQFFVKHPKKRELSAEEKAEIADRLNRNRAVKKEAVS